MKSSLIGCSGKTLGVFVLAAAFVFWADTPRADEDLAGSEWFQTKCQPSLDRYFSERSFIQSSKIADVWESPMTDQLPWPNAFRSKYARHACVSLDVTLVNETTTRNERLLCSVLDNDLPTEVKIVGNEGIAAEICAEPG